MATASNNDLNTLRQKAMVYYKINGIPIKIEEVLNSMFYDNPPDPYGYLANFFSELSKPPRLSKIKASLALDGQGTPTLLINVFCTVYNKEKLICTSIISKRDIKLWLEEQEAADLEIKASISAAINLINNDLSEKLKTLDPLKQAEIDQSLLSFMEEKKQLEEVEKERLANENTPLASATTTPALIPPTQTKSSGKKKPSKTSAKVTKSGNISLNPDKAAEPFTLGSEAVVGISLAVCTCAAMSNNLKVYRHVAKLMNPNGINNNFRIPLPMVTVMEGGKIIPGKQNLIKEFMIVPGVKMPLEKAIEHISNICSYVGKALALKYGPTAKYINESGAFCPPLDLPNQGLDMIIDAINAQGLVVNKDMHLAINIAADELFDFEKNKYEILDSALKTPDEMVALISEILTKYPSIIAIIDPLRGEDSDAWTKLCDKVSKSVYIVGNSFYNRPGILAKQQAPASTYTSGMVINFERLNTVTDVIACASTYRNLKNEIIISTNTVETSDAFLADFAVGIGAKFIKVGGILNGERSCKMNRLLQIYHELEKPEVEIILEKPDEAETLAELQAEENESKLATVVVEEQISQVLEEVTENEAEKIQIQGSLAEAEDDGKLYLKFHEPFVFPQINYPVLEFEEPVVDVAEKKSSFNQ